MNTAFILLFASTLLAMKVEGNERGMLIVFACGYVIWLKDLFVLM